MSIDPERNQPVSNRCEAEVRDRNAALEWNKSPKSQRKGGYKAVCACLDFPGLEWPGEKTAQSRSLYSLI